MWKKISLGNPVSFSKFRCPLPRDILVPILFLLVTFWRYIYISLQRWKVKKKSQTIEIKVFLIFFFRWWRDSDLYPGGPKTYGSWSITLFERQKEEKYALAWYEKLCLWPVMLNRRRTSVDDGGGIAGGTAGKGAFVRDQLIPRPLLLFGREASWRAKRSDLGSISSACSRDSLRIISQWSEGAMLTSIFTRARIFKLLRSRRIDSKEQIPPEPVYVNLLRSPGIDSQPGGPVRQPYLSYWHARLHRLAKRYLRIDSGPPLTFTNTSSGCVAWRAGTITLFPLGS